MPAWRVGLRAILAEIAGEDAGVVAAETGQTDSLMMSFVQVRGLMSTARSRRASQMSALPHAHHRLALDAIVRE